MDKNIALIDGSTNEMAHAQITLEGSRCPFLTEEYRCGIQEKLGENHLSRACSTYPRAVNLVDGVLECSLYMSCPEAVRSVLLDPNSMELAESVRSQALRFASPPTLNTTDRQYTNKPYEHFPVVRELVTSIIKNRAYPLWERLLILGFFCDHLNKLIASSPESSNIGEIVAGYKSQIDHGLFKGAFKDVPVQTSAQIDFVTKWVDARIADGDVNPRFMRTYEEFRRGLGIPDNSPADAGTAFEYAQAYSRYYQPFMDAHEHIVENYLHNYVFKALFPFGPQKSLYFEQKSVFDEYVLLVVHYAMIRSLLVGVAAYHKDGFGEDQVVSTVQSFSKAIEHNLPFLKRILQFLNGRNLNSLVYMAALVRN
jgi:lysine-N-methylase